MIVFVAVVWLQRCARPTASVARILQHLTRPVLCAARCRFVVSPSARLLPVRCAPLVRGCDVAAAGVLLSMCPGVSVAPCQMCAAGSWLGCGGGCSDCLPAVAVSPWLVVAAALSWYGLAVVDGWPWVACNRAPVLLPALPGFSNT